MHARVPTPFVRHLNAAKSVERRRTRPDSHWRVHMRVSIIPAVEYEHACTIMRVPLRVTKSRTRNLFAMKSDIIRSRVIGTRSLYCC